MDKSGETMRLWKQGAKCKWAGLYILTSAWFFCCKSTITPPTEHNRPWFITFRPFFLSWTTDYQTESTAKLERVQRVVKC